MQYHVAEQLVIRQATYTRQEAQGYNESKTKDFEEPNEEMNKERNSIKQNEEVRHNIYKIKQIYKYSTCICLMHLYLSI